MRGRYQLKKQIDGRGQYALVEVHIEPTMAGPEVVFSGEEFAWLYGIYGSNAMIEGPGFEEDRQAAVWGIDYALQQVQEDWNISDICVVVDRIEFFYVDTTPEGIAFAACHATWDALGIEGVDDAVLQYGSGLFS
ncbi:MAG: hypothetical protein JXB07_18310 [Anaerolineae bacterium]|nr:hypothetical protein [Anaerolineae bacterium]